MPSSVPPLGMTVAAAARHLGIAPATLRTWDRRYGLGPSGHTSGQHRRYTMDDVALLERVQRLVQKGVSTAEAAAAVRSGLDLPIPETVAPRPGGGNIISVPRAMPVARGLARAAMAMDADACLSIVRQALEERGTIDTWERVLLPVLQGIGDRFATSGAAVEVEHLLSSSIEFCLQERARRLSGSTSVGGVLLTVAPTEQHTLPVWALADALAERHVASRVLVPQTPIEALDAAIRRTGPAVVFVWAQIPGSSNLSQLDQLSSVRPAPAILAGGAGWHGECPAGVSTVDSLIETVLRINRVVGV